VSCILIDTDILIDISRKDQIAIDRIKQESYTSELFVSCITVMELLVGCRNKTELMITKHFLSKFRTINLTHKISDRATDLIQLYFLSHGLLIPDALIAATAIEEKFSLLTKNQRDFRFITDLNLILYP